MSLCNLSVQSYEDAIRCLNGRTARRVANNTTAHLTPEGDVVFRLHFTDIVTWKKDGTCILDAGRWKTVTTKDRMNRLVPGFISIYQKKRQWFITRRDWNKTLLFTNGVTITKEGHLIKAAGD